MVVSGLFALLFLCIGLSEGFSEIGFWGTFLFLGGASVLFFILWNRYRNFPVGYDNVCQNCGYKWISDPED